MDFTELHKGFLKLGEELAELNKQSSELLEQVKELEKNLKTRSHLVYVVQEDTYAPGVLGIFSTKEKAQGYIDSFKGDFGHLKIVEFELDNPQYSAK